MGFSVEQCDDEFMAAVLQYPLMSPRSAVAKMRLIHSHSQLPSDGSWQSELSAKVKKAHRAAHVLRLESPPKLLKARTSSTDEPLERPMSAPRSKQERLDRFEQFMEAKENAAHRTSTYRAARCDQSSTLTPQQPRCYENHAMIAHSALLRRADQMESEECGKRVQGQHRCE